MTPEEFLKEHHEIIRKALSSYTARMEVKAGEMGDLVDTFRTNTVYSQMENDFYALRDRARGASNALFVMSEHDGDRWKLKNP
jgi:hypothetical protein